MFFYNINVKYLVFKCKMNICNNLIWCLFYDVGVSIIGNRI